MSTFTRCRDGITRRNYVETTLTVEVEVGDEGCEDTIEVDVIVGGCYIPAEPDVGAYEGIEDLDAWTDGPYGSVGFTLSEADEERAERELIQAWKEGDCDV
jgi:hypothetical protein